MQAILSDTFWKFFLTESILDPDGGKGNVHKDTMY